MIASSFPQAAEKGPSAALARSRGGIPPCIWTFFSSLVEEWCSPKRVGCKKT
jgi:hypothetical protein